MPAGVVGCVGERTRGNTQYNDDAAIGLVTARSTAAWSRRSPTELSRRRLHRGVCGERLRRRLRLAPGPDWHQAKKKEKGGLARAHSSPRQDRVLADWT